MKPAFLLVLAVVAGVAGAAGWYLGTRTSPGPAGAGGGDAESRRVLYYQSAMHPWIKSDQPGKCTICGMELTPVFEGETGLAADSGLVVLRSNSVSVLNVRSAEIGRGVLERTLRVAGVLEADETRRRVISAYAAGRIEELHVNYAGAEFDAGQPLIRFYSPALLEAERQFLAVLRSDRLGTGGDESRILREAAGQRLRQLGLTDAQIAELPSKSPTNHVTEILAPVGGTVVRRLVLAGQYVAEGEPLLEIADLSTLWFQFDVYEQDLPWLEPGQEVEITTPSVPGRTFRAPIRFINPTLQGDTRSAKVRAELANPRVEENGHRRLVPGQRLYAEGRVVTRSPDLLVVPRSAVLSTGDRAMVYLDRGAGAYEPRPVRLGRVGDQVWEVVDGLVDGDRVVVQGNLLLDAQAQLDQAIQGPPHAGVGAGAGGSEAGTATAAAAAAPLTERQRQVLRDLLERTDGLRVALAADDLAAFEAARMALSGVPEAAASALAPEDPRASRVAELVGALSMTPASDLRAARKAFLPASHAAVALVRALRSEGPGFAAIRILQCPMTAEAFEGAPRRARWIQFTAPVRNPWFGAEMLECGVELADEAAAP